MDENGIADFKVFRFLLGKFSIVCNVINEII